MDFIPDYRMQKPIDALLELIFKLGAFLSYVTIGLIALFGYDIAIKKRITKWYVISTSCMGFSIGWLSYQMCLAHPAWNPGIIVPMATIISRDVMIFISMIDWQGVLKLLTNKNTRDRE